MTIRVTVTGSSRRPRVNWQAAAAEWASQVGPLAEAALKRQAPVGQGPGAGRLRDSITHTQAITAHTATLTFTAHVPYAGYVLDGTVPHIIRPRQAGALHWTDSGGSHFASIVHHPGTQPDDFPRRALRPLIPILRERLDTALAAQLSE